MNDVQTENPFARVGLQFIQLRLQELADNLPIEVDLDTNELLLLQQAIRLYEPQMTSDIALNLKKSLEQIERFVEDQKKVLQGMMRGASVSKNMLGNYSSNTTQPTSRFVYRKA